MQIIHKPKPKPELMTQTELLAYVHELEQENKRLEESFQKATGVIATDSLPTVAEMRKVSEMCKANKNCSGCKYRYYDSEYATYECIFDGDAEYWSFGGTDDELSEA